MTVESGVCCWNNYSLDRCSTLIHYWLNLEMYKTLFMGLLRAHIHVYEFARFINSCKCYSLFIQFMIRSPISLMMHFLAYGRKLENTGKPYCPLTYRASYFTIQWKANILQLFWQDPSLHGWHARLQNSDLWPLLTSSQYKFNSSSNALGKKNRLTQLYTDKNMYVAMQSSHFETRRVVVLVLQHLTTFFFSSVSYLKHSGSFDEVTITGLV